MIKKVHENTFVFTIAIVGTLILFYTFGLYTVIIFPILLFLMVFIFRKKKN